MLLMMFFYDGKLSDVSGGDDEQIKIDAGDGWTDNLRKFSEVMMSDKKYMVITNQIGLLNNTWLWDTNTHKPSLCLLDKSDGKWKPVGRFTKQHIKNSRNLAKMFLEGAFREKAYREAAPRVRGKFIQYEVPRDDDE